MVNPDHLTRSLLQAQVNSLSLIYGEMLATDRERALTITAMFRFS